MNKLTGLKLIICILANVLIVQQASSQSTAERVYNIMQTHCATAGCHSNADKMAGLDLQGTAMIDVYNNVVDVVPQNTAAAAKHNKLIYPGDPYRSFIYRKLAHGKEAFAALESDEGGAMPAYGGGAGLSDVEREVVRQWILYGAPSTGTVIDEELLEEFYSGNGYWTIDPQDPPPAPAVSEGIQVRVGPIFLPPSSSTQTSEVEYYTKYETNLPATEVHQIDMTIGSSHHFIIYTFSDDASDRSFGFRENANHSTNVGYLVGVQENSNFDLPEGTAFKWQDNLVLDMNPHVINYSQSAVMATDVYVNIYTQPNGIAAQEMRAQLLPNFNLNIPNDGEEHFIEAPFSFPFNANLYLWNIGSHTHARGNSFDVWTRNPDGSKGDQIYSATRYNGIPECEEIAYDYQHPPTRYFGEFLPLNISNGIIHRASYINNTNKTLHWGATSEDEMMITAIMYVLNTSGVTFGEASVCQEDEFVETGIDEFVVDGSFSLSVYPNPAAVRAYFDVSNAQPNETFTLHVMSLEGAYNNTHTFTTNSQGKALYELSVKSLNNGIYIVELEDSAGNFINGKLMVQH